MSQPMFCGKSQINGSSLYELSAFVHLITWINFWKYRIVSHIFAYQYIEITRISAVLFKSMYHYKYIYSKMTFLHLTGFHLQCNLIQPFHYHSQPLTFYFQSETVIFNFLDIQKYMYKTVGFPGVGQKLIPNVSFFPSVFGPFLRLNQSYGENPMVIISTVCCTPKKSW